MDAAAELIVRLVGNDPARWSKVLDELHLVPESHRNQVIDRLRNFPLDDIDPEERRGLAEQLRKIIRRQRDFAYADWALPAESVEALERALPALLPDGLQERHAWLFVPWIDLEGFRDDYEEMQAEIDRLRADALREIVNQGGFDGILKLADIVESPEQVGADACACRHLSPTTGFCLTFCEALMPTTNRLRRIYARVRIRPCWLGLGPYTVVGTMECQKTPQSFCPRRGFVLKHGTSRRAWARTSFREFWKIVPAHGGLDLDQQQLEFACRRLMEADRPESAINILSRVAFGKVAVSPSVVMDAPDCMPGVEKDQSGSGFGNDTLHTIQRTVRMASEDDPIQ